MKKRESAIMAVITLFAVMAHAQTVYQKDRWGAKLYYMQDNAIRQKDRWGEQLLWYDAATQQVRQKDRWGQPLLYIDGQTVENLTTGSSDPTYEIVSVSKKQAKKVKLKDDGKLVLKKGIKKCKIEIAATSAANDNRNECVQTLVIKVKK